MKHSGKITTIIALFFTLTSFTIKDKESDDFARTFPLSDVELSESWIKQRENINTKYLLSLNTDRLLHNFKVNANLPSNATPLEGWEHPHVGLRGHFTGHYLSAISMLINSSNDTTLMARLNYMIDELEKCQIALDKNGYLSAFPEQDLTHIETWHTGVWAPYYTINKILQGLIHAYQYAGNEKAYGMALQLAHYVEARISRMSADNLKKMLQTAWANPQNEPGAMNETLYNLYELSHDERHLLLAEKFEPDWFLSNMYQGNDILSGLHSNTHIVYVNGFAKRYELTSNATYGTATKNFWDMLIGNHAYVNGSSSGPRPFKTTPTAQTAEHWSTPNQLSATLTNEIAESCVSHNTQKISKTLFATEQSCQYADAYMNTFYNSIMALQSAHTGRCTYHLPLGSPHNKWWLTESDFRCCNGSSIEAFANLNSGIYFHKESELWINMYIPSTLNWKEKGVKIVQNGNFPYTPTTTIQIAENTSESAFSINLFIPSWATNTQILVNGKPQKKAKPMSHASIKREWKKGDKITITFDYKFHIKSMPDDENIIAIFYGPMLLAFINNNELILSGSKEEILQNLSCHDLTTMHFTLKNAGRVLVLKPLFMVENETYSVYTRLSNIFF